MEARRRHSWWLFPSNEESETTTATDDNSIPRLQTPVAPINHDPSRLGTFLNRKRRPRSILTDIYSPSRKEGTSNSSNATHFIPVPNLSAQLPRSPRRPRHVPIVIPDYAQPHAPHLYSSSTPSPGHPRNLTTPADARNPVLELPDDHQTQIRRVRSSHTMNNSQLSLSASESGTDSSAPPAPTSRNNIGISNSASFQQSGNASNLSGLVCNVHRTTGHEPHALVGATTTVLGDKLYVFGGRVHSRTKPQLTSNLYELDLIRRHWTKIDTLGSLPPPRYFHSVCPLGDTKLVCYGGMSPAPHLRPGASGQSQPSKSTAEPQPEVVVMSDIHVYDVLTRTWTLIVPSVPDGPQGRYAHCATILPSHAVFTSADAPNSAILHNQSSELHSGTLGVQLDGTGGAEMVVVGGQDSANNYIEQISVFNLRSLKWTSSTPYDGKCGAYKSMVAGMPGINAKAVGSGAPVEDTRHEQTGSAMLIYSNYNFLDVKLELQIRMPDGNVVERRMAGPVSPPGLRFPNGGVINGYFVVSGTYLTSSKHEYAIWALDLKTLTWGVIDTAGSVFAQGSWNRGVMWNRRNTFVILGHRKRSLVDDYNHRRVNFAHICLVELEAFGLYENPRRTHPTSAYLSNSAPVIPTSLQQSLPSKSAGGRVLSSVAEQLGLTAFAINELSDMEIVAHGGERIPCNSHILSKRWGPYFNQLLLESVPNHDGTASDAATLRPMMQSQASRISAITITPGVNGLSAANADNTSSTERSQSRSTARTLIELPSTSTVPAATRSRSLYLPHTPATIRLLLHYLYTSNLPSLPDSRCSPHTLCSLLQMARPYQIDGLQEATIERLHEVLDGRNAAAVFNAAAMAAGGGRATGIGMGGTLEALERRESLATGLAEDELRARTTGLQVSTDGVGPRRGHRKTDSGDSTSTTTSATTSTSFSQTDTESSRQESSDAHGAGRSSREVWSGDISSVIGLQKRGLRGLMEGRRLRERANTGD